VRTPQKYRRKEGGKERENAERGRGEREREREREREILRSTCARCSMKSSVR